MAKVCAVSHKPRVNGLFAKQRRCGRSCVFEPQQLEAILAETNKASQFWGTLFSTLALSGARVSQTLTVKWEDVQTNELVLQSARKVACPKLMDVLREWREAQSRERPVSGDDFVFGGAKPVTHIVKQSVDKMLRKICARLDIKGASTHSFRLTWLNDQLDQGVAQRAL